MKKRAIRKKILNSLNKQAFLDEKNIALTSREKEILSSATAQELQEAKEFAENLSKKNTEELIAEEDARLAAILAE